MKKMLILVSLFTGIQNVSQSQQSYTVIMGHDSTGILCHIDGLQERKSNYAHDSAAFFMFASPCAYDFYKNGYRAHCENGGRYMTIKKRIFGRRELEDNVVKIQTKKAVSHFQIDSLRCNKLYVGSSSPIKLSISGLHANEAQIIVSKASELTFSGTVNKAIFSSGTGHAAVSFETVVMQTVIIQSQISISKCKTLPDTLLFDDDHQETVDLSLFLDDRQTLKYIYTTNFLNWNFNYNFFQILPINKITKKTLNTNQLFSLYTQLLENQKKHGYDQGFEKADKEFRRLKFYQQGWVGSVKNWISHTWWDYGYGKHLIFRNASILFLCALMLNFIFYKPITTTTYRIEKIVEAEDISRRKFVGRPLRRVWRKFAHCLLFTCYIFWGWKLDFDKLQITNIGLALIIVIQYLAGIVCLAYLAGYIITK